MAIDNIGFTNSTVDFSLDESTLEQSTFNTDSFLDSNDFSFDTNDSNTDISSFQIPTEELHTDTNFLSNIGEKFKDGAQNFVENVKQSFENGVIGEGESSLGEAFPPGNTVQGRPLTTEEKQIYTPYFPKEVLDNTTIYDGKMPPLVWNQANGITLGDDIYFKEGAYSPGTPEGIEILGHELTHAAQFDSDLNYIKYIWDSRHGYENNPHEIEAYDKGEEIRNDVFGSSIDNL
jgi:hypothetical protein